MTRQIILDTETTGLNARLGDRVIEIGCVEMVDRRFTGNHFHRYLNPERPVEAGALRIHGLTDEFLADKPKFAQVAAEFVDYIRGAELIIHNATFDIEFLDEEFRRLDLGAVRDQVSGVIDTLLRARELHPGKKNSLDALCERYAIDNARRTLHGALLDAELLAEVYLGMTRGQETLAIEVEEPTAAARGERQPRTRGGPLLVVRASDEETAAHQQVLESIKKETKGACVWLS